MISNNTFDVKYKKALVIGRFQPVHIGHLSKLQHLDNLGLEKIYLGIGVNGKINDRNPFNYEQVRRMWTPLIKDFSSAVEIFKIPDINKQEEYANHVEKITGCNSNDTVLVSDNYHTIDCFVNYGNNYKIYDTGLFHVVNDSYINATRIRDWLKFEGPWQDYVPKKSIEIIKKTFNYEK